MARARMSIEGKPAVPLKPRKGEGAQVSKSRRWKKVLLWVVSLTGIAVLLFCVFVFNIFEGSASQFTHYVPSNVEFFLMKKDLTQDLDENYEPLFLPKLRKTSYWANFRRSGDYVSEIRDTGIEVLCDDIVATLRDMPIDLLSNVVGNELVIAGRAPQGVSDEELAGLTKEEMLRRSTFALHLRVTWKVKLAYQLLRFGMFGSTLPPGVTTRQEDDHVVLTGLASDMDLLAWRFKDMLVISNDKEYLDQVQKLTEEEAVTTDSFELTAMKERFDEEHQKDLEANDSEAYWIMKPRGALHALGFKDRFPVPPEDPRSSFATRFLGQIFSTDLVDSIVGYSRASTDPLEHDPDSAGLRVRGQIRMYEERRQGETGGTGIDSDKEIAQDREQFLAPRMSDNMRVIPQSNDDMDKPLSFYADLVPEDAALWLYYAGDLEALFHLFERSFAPRGKPGEDWDRDMINEKFAEAIEKFNRRVETVRNVRMREIPAEAIREARQEFQRRGRGEPPQEQLDRLAEIYRERLIDELPRAIQLEGVSGTRPFRAISDRMAGLFSRDSYGRAMLVVRRNDYGDLRKLQKASEGSVEIPEFYDPTDLSPAWAFVIWIDGASKKEAESTVDELMESIQLGEGEQPETVKSLEVTITSPQAGRQRLKEYWHDNIPGPGQIATAVIPFWEEQSVNRQIIDEGARGGRRRSTRDLSETVTLFVISNHIMLAQDLAQSAIFTKGERLEKMRGRLGQSTAFARLTRREIDQASNMFLYWNGDRLADIREDSLEKSIRQEAEVELDNPESLRRFFREAAQELGLASIYREGVPIDTLWRSVPKEKEDQMHLTIARIRDLAVEDLIPKLKERMSLSATYPSLNPLGAMSLHTVSAKPLKVNFQFFTLFDLSQEG